MNEPATSTSPGTPSGSREVASTFTEPCCAKSARGEPGTRFEEVLAVVEHEERRFVRQRRDQLLDGLQPRLPRGRRAPRALLARPRPGSATPASSTNHTPPGNCSRSSAATASASRVLPTPPDPVNVTSRSAPTSRAERGDVLVSADERRELDREVVRVRVERAQLRMRGGQVRVDDLPHALRPAEVLQAVHPEVGQARLLRQAVDDEPRGRVRHEDLVAVADRAQPRASDHGLTEVVALVAQLGLAGVDRHAHVEVGALRPVLAEEPSLGVDRGGDGVGRACERGDDAVAFSLLDRPNAAMVGDASSRIS